MPSLIFSVAKRSQNLENSTYLWYGCSGNYVYFEEMLTKIRTCAILDV